MSIFKILNCEGAKHLCDKNQYKEASFLEKINLSINLIFCKSCRDYTKKNNILTKLITNSSKAASMPATNKQSLKDRLAEEIAKQNQN